MIEKLLTARDVMDVVRIESAALSRWIAENRFPAPINKGGKRLWTKKSILDWCESQEQQAPPPTSIPNRREQKRQTKDWQARQEKADATVARHIQKKTKTKGGSK